MDSIRDFTHLVVNTHAVGRDSCFLSRENSQFKISNSDSVKVNIELSVDPEKATDSGIGAGVDSFFEYLVKGYVLLNDETLLEIWRQLEIPIEKFLNQNDWYVWANMKTGSTTSVIAQSLDGFFPGMKTLLGEVEPAMRTHLNYYDTWREFNAWPEFYAINQKLPIQAWSLINCAKNFSDL